ncbi:MAG: M28 family peptidase, partial [Taibaiella sp.]|nr:M28 family peptidase [Taibaiella sp.]
MFYCPFRFLLAAGLIHLSITTTATEAGEAALRRHVAQLTSGKGYRNYKDTLALNRTAAYIFNEFATVTKETYTQDFTARGARYRNVYASFGPANAPRIIIGAHYDVCGEQPGADDNASGIAALLELARMFAETDKSKWEMRVDLVAYCLEEPPYFGTQDMGSSVHATALFNNKTPVAGMVSLEMIGYFSDD